LSKRERWWEFHLENPGVYALFEQYAFDMIRSGVGKTSAWLIVNRIRWEVVLKTVGSEYKISNDFIQYYARLFMRNNPRFNKFFDTKTIKGEDDTWWHPLDEAA
jgi:hypothetical protein